MRFNRASTRTIFLCFLSIALGRGYAQTSTHISTNPFGHSVAELAFSAFVTATPKDTADTICPRSAAGATVTAPPELTSQNGTLEVTFKFQTTVDAQGLTRYCYVTDTGLVSPTLRVNPGDKLVIHFQNNIPVAQTSSQQMPGMKMQLSDATTGSDCNAQTMDATSTNLHFHGVNAAPVCHQDEVIHTMIGAQQSFDYSVQIPSNEPPGLYWYHPHPHGFSEAQVLGGASGAIIVQGLQSFNTSLNGLPEKTFVLRDQKVAYSGTQSGVTRPQTDLSINYVPVTYPNNTPATMNAAPNEKELWRVLNASADTMMNIQVLIGSTPQQLQIVAVDGVPLKDSNGNATSVTQTNYALSPASRVEFVLTTPNTGQQGTLVTETWDNGTDGDADPGRTIANIVPTTSSTTSSQIAQQGKLSTSATPRKLTRFAALDSTTPATQRKLYFTENSDFSQFYVTVDGQTPAVFDMNAPPSITVQDGTVEQWTIENRSKMDHNFHIHQIHFQTLAVNGTTVTDTMLKDTINVPHWSGNTSDPYPSVTLLMDFRDPNIVGTFVYHCHILSHEDRGMMGAIQVLPASTTTTLTASATQVTQGTAVALKATVTGSGTTGVPTGTVTFYSGTTALGTAALDSSGAATYSTTTLPVGSDSITAQYGGSTSFTASTSTAVVVTVTSPPPDFSVSDNPATLTIARGQSGTTTLTVTPVNGFSSQVSLSCSGLPSEAQCSFTPQSVTPDGTNATSSQVTITTTAATASLQNSPMILRHPLYAFLFPGLGAAFGLLITRRKHMPKGMRLFGLLLVMFSLFSFIGACGSSTGSGNTKGGTTSNPGTPVGSTTVTITATSSGSAAITHASTLTLTVTQ